MWKAISSRIVLVCPWFLLYFSWRLLVTDLPHRPSRITSWPSHRILLYAAKCWVLFANYAVDCNANRRVISHLRKM
ncbi:hypothetical protein B0O99DRAFT_628692, partial [Bisporella sp. PMI_857]